MKPFISTKWPGLLVKGENVTKDQAAEIIVRTTRWPLSSNNEELDKIFNNLIASEKEWNKGLSKIKALPIYYLCNERITTSYYKGPKGWIDWDGRIFSCEFNIGKWPSVEEVTREWEIIAKEFPFLKLRAQVIDSEISDDKEDFVSTAEWVLENGKAEVLYPKELLVEVPKRQEAEDFLSDLFAPHAVPDVKDVKRGISLALSKY